MSHPQIVLDLIDAPGRRTREMCSLSDKQVRHGDHNHQLHRRRRIPERCAFAKPHRETRVALAGNANPHLEWWDVPEGTRSFAVICHDYDVPSAGDDVNQPDREVPAELPRVDFFHWVLVDLPADKRSIEEGEFADGVVAGGQDADQGPHGTRQGLNDFTGWFW
jgi:phosphatidylethanolamine-binding protein (PEBP) family uncharacterized protein